MEVASVKAGVGMLVGGGAVGVAVSGTAVDVAVGGGEVGVWVDGTAACVTVGGTGVGAAAGATHPIRVNVTNISPIH